MNKLEIFEKWIIILWNQKTLKIQKMKFHTFLTLKNNFEKELFFYTQLT